MIRIAVIGTAGRRIKLTKDWYFRAFEELEQQLEGLEDYELVSGGAAWSDHLAISHYLKYGTKLEIHLPGKLNNTGMVGNSDANTANYYHERFSLAMGTDAGHTLETIRNLPTGWVHFNMGGFKARNLDVARKLDIMLAFGTDTTLSPMSGTYHTWRNAKLCKDKRYIHIPV